MASEDYSIGSDYTASMGEISKRFDEIGRTLAYHGQQLSEISKKLDDQELARYDQRAILAAHTRDLREIRGEMRTVNGKLDQVIALLTKQGE